MTPPSIRVEPGKIYGPVSLTMKFQADSSLVLTCQRMGDRPHRGTTPLGLMTTSLGMTTSRATERL